jgi:DeoR family fructose operon transcriptional repressor
MSDPLFLEERRQAILDLLQRRERVTVKELSEAMQVSEVTIRQDLRALQEQGLLERTYGGAVPRSGAPSLNELSFNVRLAKKQAEKDLIAAAAASLVHDGYSIALDSSTTTYALVPYLKQFDNLTIVTNSLMVAQSFLSKEEQQVRVLLAGGKLRRDAISTVGMPESLPNVNLNLCFFGARGIAQRAGASEIDPDEVTIKQAMIVRCVHPVLLVDGSKWGQVAPFTIVPTAELHHIITSSDAPLDEIGGFREVGVRVDVIES